MRMIIKAAAPAGLRYQEIGDAPIHWQTHRYQVEGQVRANPAKVSTFGNNANNMIAAQTAVSLFPGVKLAAYV
jgi:hypothetical protein